MIFPERKNIYYISTFFGNWEALGITLNKQYVYIGHVGMTDSIELYEISDKTYLQFIQAYQNENHDMLEQLRHEIYLTPCIAFEYSNYEPNPIALMTYHDSEQYQEYFNFVCNHVITEAVFSGNTVILKSIQGESLTLKLNLSKFKEENSNGK